MKARWLLKNEVLASDLWDGLLHDLGEKQDAISAGWVKVYHRTGSMVWGTSRLLCQPVEVILMAELSDEESRFR